MSLASVGFTLETTSRPRDPTRDPRVVLKSDTLSGGRLRPWLVTNCRAKSGCQAFACSILWTLSSQQGVGLCSCTCRCTIYRPVYRPATCCRARCLVMESSDGSLAHAAVKKANLFASLFTACSQLDASNKFQSQLPPCESKMSEI
ncbi:hypothetical protein ACJJTC_007432 [Scirpophaga incertulas]